MPLEIKSFRLSTEPSRSAAWPASISARSDHSGSLNASRMSTGTSWVDKEFRPSGSLRVMEDRMRIAQVAPLAEAVPPKLYGGTERVVSWLTEELVRKGHQVTLFASGDSETAAETRALRAAGPEARRNPRPYRSSSRDARPGAAPGPRVRPHPLPRRPAAIPAVSRT